MVALAESGLSVSQPRYPEQYGKIGTVPVLMKLRSRKPFRVGDKIEFKRAEHDCAPWRKGIVTCSNPLKLDLL